tara:strand:+ start:5283 stop:5816 length:534 start_codon:yes stop_codon:yes gene_type:complete
MKKSRFELFDNQLIIFLFILVLPVFISCGPGKRITKEKTVEIFKSDSIFSKITTIKSAPVNTNFTIKNLCDSLTGAPKDFSNEFSVGNTRIKISSENNDFIFELAVKDSIISQLKETNEKLIKTELVIETTDELRFRTPGWAFWALGVNVLLIVILAMIIVPGSKNVVSWVLRLFKK